MVALAAARYTKSKNLGAIKRYPVGVDIIYAGGMVMINSAGYAVPALAESANNGCVGVATTTVDNSGGSAGDLNVSVQEGWFLFDAQTLAQANVGEVMYADDDQTIDETQAANAPVVGILMEFVSASEGWVKISQADAAIIEATN